MVTRPIPTSVSPKFVVHTICLLGVCETTVGGQLTRRVERTRTSQGVVTNSGRERGERFNPRLPSWGLGLETNGSSGDRCKDVHVRPVVFSTTGIDYLPAGPHLPSPRRSPCFTLLSGSDNSTTPFMTGLTPEVLNLGRVSLHPR